MKKSVFAVLLLCMLSVNAFSDESDAGGAVLAEPKVYYILAVQEKLNSLYQSAIDAYERMVHYIKTKYGK